MKSWTQTLRKPVATLAAVLLLAGSALTGAAAEAGETPAQAASTLDWNQFLGNEELKGVSDAKTPRTAEEFKKAWISAQHNGNIMFNHISPTVIVGDYVYYNLTDPEETYTASTNRTLVKADAKTGEIVAKSEEFAGGGQMLPQIAAGGGKIYVFGVDTGGSRIYAFDQEDLSLSFKTAVISGSQIESPILYYDGYVYAGVYGGSQSKPAQFACFDATGDSAEELAPVWTYSESVYHNRGGYLWSGPTIVGDAIVFTNTNGYVTSLNRKTGQMIDTYLIPESFQGGEQLTTTPYYYEKNQRLYVSTAGTYGGILGIKMNADGSFNEEDVISFLDTETGKAIKSSVVIYNDRLYVIGGGGHDGSGAPFRVMDANTLEVIYEYEGLNAKGSIVLTTAYATKENKQTVYLYAMAYQNPKHVENNQNVFDKMIVYVFQDYEGLDHAICEEVDLIELGIVEPTQGQYISQTFSIDQFGNLSMYWDSNYVICIGNKEDTTITGDDVKQQIDRMPDVNEYKYYNNFELRRIRERYDALSEEEKAKVTNLDKLTAMLEASEKLPEERLDELMDAIAALPAGDELTLDNAETVENLYSLYSQMTDKTLVENGAVLEAAYAKIQQLRGEDAAAKLVADIAALPAADKLTLADEGTVAGLEYRLEALGEDYAAKVTNADVLEAARTRINAIHAALESLDTLLAAKLNGPITLESKALIDEAIQAMEGLDPADIATLTSYEQYFVPATVDYVNLLLDSLFTEDALTPVTQDNVATLKDTLAQIETYYAYIPEADQKYVTKADAAAEMQAAIDAFEQGTDTPDTPETPDTTQKPDSPDTPDTGDAFPWLAVTLLGMALITGMVCSRRFQKHA